MDEREEYLVKRIKDLEASLEKAEAATKEIGTLVDAMMLKMAQGFGVKEPDGGYRLKLPVFNAREMVEKYEVTVEKDDFWYVIRTHRREV